MWWWCVVGWGVCFVWGRVGRCVRELCASRRDLSAISTRSRRDLKMISVHLGAISVHLDVLEVLLGDLELLVLVLAHLWG